MKIFSDEGEYCDPTERYSELNEDDAWVNTLHFDDYHFWIIRETKKDEFWNMI